MKKISSLVCAILLIVLLVVPIIEVSASSNAKIETESAWIGLSKDDVLKLKGQPTSTASQDKKTYLYFDYDVLFEDRSMTQLIFDENEKLVEIIYILKVDKADTVNNAIDFFEKTEDKLTQLYGQSRQVTHSLTEGSGFLVTKNDFKREQLRVVNKVNLLHLMLFEDHPNLGNIVLNAIQITSPKTFFASALDFFKNVITAHFWYQLFANPTIRTIGLIIIAIIVLITTIIIARKRIR